MRTRRQSVFVARRVATATMDDFVAELKAKLSKMTPRRAPAPYARKPKAAKVPRVRLNDAGNRVLPPKPPVEDPLQQHIEAIRARAQTLKKVEVRVDNGVIIIDD